MSANFSPHEAYRDEEPTEPGSNRAFGCTVGTMLMLIGAAKALVAGAIPLVACLIFATGAALLLVGIVAPSRLSALNRLWSKLGAGIAKVVNPILLLVLFFLVITPLALFMRMAGKRPFRLAADPTAPTYWVNHDLGSGSVASMKRQF